MAIFAKVRIFCARVDSFNPALSFPIIQLFSKFFKFSSAFLVPSCKDLIWPKSSSIFFLLSSSPARSFSEVSRFFRASSRFFLFSLLVEPLLVFSFSIRGFSSSFETRALNSLRSLLPVFDSTVSLNIRFTSSDFF